MPGDEDMSKETHAILEKNGISNRANVEGWRYGRHCGRSRGTAVSKTDKCPAVTELTP